MTKHDTTRLYVARPAEADTVAFTAMGAIVTSLSQGDFEGVEFFNKPADASDDDLLWLDEADGMVAEATLGDPEIELQYLYMTEELGRKVLLLCRSAGRAESLRRRFGLGEANAALSADSNAHMFVANYTPVMKGAPHAASQIAAVYLFLRSRMDYPVTRPVPPIFQARARRT